MEECACQRNKGGNHHVTNRIHNSFSGRPAILPVPCVLPLIPSYVSFITGISFDDFKTGDKARIRRLTLINSFAFVFGFSTVFVLLGVSSSYVGKIFAVYYDHIRVIGG